MDDFTAANRANWDERVPSHLKAYGAEDFADDPHAISAVVRDDALVMAPHLPGGSVAGLDLLHLQCHIGTDTLSWGRLGARVTGVDFSSESIAAARMLAERSGVAARFEISTVDAAPEAIHDRFDVVYTSVGVLVWLPRLDVWANAIYALLKPGGLFYVRDSHPILAAIDYDRNDGVLALTNPYFETDQPARYDDGMTYASADVRLANATTYEWSHSLSEIMQALLDAGLTITSFAEGQTIPWKALPSLVESPAGYVLPDGGDRLPLEFSLTARRPSAS
jgi:SAM-dependent methyltransferase